MILRECRLPGVYVVDLEPLEDDRGFFARTWCAETMAEAGLAASLSQCSLSYNRAPHTLRGLHYQAAPHGEVKLVRCSAGAIFDVLLDLRSDSPTYLQWEGFELTAANRRAVYVPEGVAHGFQTLVPDSEVFYQINVPFAPGFARGVRWNDPAFGIAWPEAARRILSDRDATYPDFAP